MMVLMALITTAMTGPLLKRVYSDRVMQRDIEAAERAALGVIDSYRVLVLVDDQQRARAMAAVGAALLGTGRPAEVVLSRLITRPEGAAGGGRRAGPGPGADGQHRRRAGRAVRRADRPRREVLGADPIHLRPVERPGRAGDRCRGRRRAGRPAVRRISRPGPRRCRSTPRSPWPSRDLGERGARRGRRRRRRRRQRRGRPDGARAGIGRGRSSGRAAAGRGPGGWPGRPAGDGRAGAAARRRGCRCRCWTARRPPPRRRWC